MNLTTVSIPGLVQVFTRYIEEWIEWIVEYIILPGSRIIQQHAWNALILYYTPTIVLTILTAISLLRR